MTERPALNISSSFQSRERESNENIISNFIRNNVEAVRTRGGRVHSKRLAPLRSVPNRTYYDTMPEEVYVRCHKKSPSTMFASHPIRPSSNSEAQSAKALKKSTDT